MTWAGEVGIEAGRVLETTGVVEYRTHRAQAWTGAGPGLEIRPGQWLRTGPGSRAAVLLSDRSIVRLGERTTLEVMRPRTSEKRRFGLLEGILYFFNRERPAEVEFEAPMATGVIRGTEFVLSAGGADGVTRLALLEGRVELSASATTLAMVGGEEARVEEGRPPVKSPLLETTRVIQWALYYPAVVIPEDLGLDGDDEGALAPALAEYRAGDVAGAWRLAGRLPAGGPGRERFLAALDLAVGLVDRAESRLAASGGNHAVARALRELIVVVREGRSGGESAASDPATATEWLARSYTRQARFDLGGARTAAREAVRLAPGSGFALAREAEMEFAFERRPEALAGLERALRAAPRLAMAHVLRGFVLLERRDSRAALAAFVRARELEGGLGSAWLGEGLARMQMGHEAEALPALEAAVALEPRRSLPRSYLAKAFSQLGEAALAEKEFGLARGLDPADPTPWLYSALHAGQVRRPNEAVRHLARSVELNDHRQLFRSRLSLDRDLAVRHAHLAGLYRDAGLTEAGRVAAIRSVADDPVGFAGHLYLAGAYREMENANRYDLRLETARYSELLVANLLAPPGAGNLSQLAAQQEFLRFFDARPWGGTSLTEYRSTGDWRQEASLYGTAGGLGYALDAAWVGRNGQELHDDLERWDLSFQGKQRVGDRDEAYLQIGYSRSRGGDVARHYDPSDIRPGLRVEEEQAPNVHVGWHRAWSPESHTLLLLSRLADRFALEDDDPGVLFLRRTGGIFTAASTPPLFELTQRSRFTVYGGELQHLWQTEHHALVAGVRAQAGDVESAATLARAVSGVVSAEEIDEPLRRVVGYAYHQWHPVRSLRLLSGLAYDRLEHPRNSEIAPLSPGSVVRGQLGPKAGVLYEPWTNGLARAAYTRSLGGIFSDQSVRLEPTQVAGFNQAFRSLLPESAAGLVPGTGFEAIQAGFDQSFAGGTFAGVELQWLRSEGDRWAGVLTNSLPVPVPDSPSATRQVLDFEERSFAAYLVRLLGDGWSVGARYRLAEARLERAYPDLPAGLPGLEQLVTTESGLLQQLGLSLAYRHARGLFGEWESDWYRQSNDGFAPVRPDDAFWQHHVFVGYRWPRHRAELRAGIMNLTDADYRLNPLHDYRDPPRQRTAVIRLRIHF